MFIRNRGPETGKKVYHLDKKLLAYIVLTKQQIVMNNVLKINFPANSFDLVSSEIMYNSDLP